MATNTVVQRSYAPTIRPAVEGMIADETSSEVGTWLCETVAGIGFGKAVSVGTGRKGAVIGGASNFIGITVRDISLDGTPIIPNATQRVPVDTYGLNQNMGVMTRGRIWVMARAAVTPGIAAFYDATTGGFGKTGGSQATGYIDFTQNPSDGQAITINTTTWTFKATGATGTQTNIQGTLGDTIAKVVNDLNATGDATIAAQTYAAYPDIPRFGGSGATRLLISADAVGTAANAFPLGTTVTGASTSGAQMAGGSVSAVAMTGARWLTPAIAGQLAIVSLSSQY
jgi:hypothetical protein